jgi:hypothetical protein
MGHVSQQIIILDRQMDKPPEHVSTPFKQVDECWNTHDQEDPAVHTNGFAQPRTSHKRGWRGTSSWTCCEPSSHTSQLEVPGCIQRLQIGYVHTFNTAASKADRHSTVFTLTTQSVPQHGDSGRLPATACTTAADA